MRDKLRAKARFKISDSPEQVGIETVARGRLSDGGMKSNGSLDSKRDIRFPVSVGLCATGTEKVRIAKSKRLLMNVVQGNSDARTVSSQS